MLEFGLGTHRRVRYRWKHQEYLQWPVVCIRVNWNVHRLMSYLLITCFDQWDPSTATLIEEVCEPQGISMWKNKPHLVTFHESILLSIWTFLLNFIERSETCSWQTVSQKNVIFLAHSITTEWLRGLPLNLGNCLTTETDMNVSDIRLLTKVRVR